MFISLTPEKRYGLKVRTQWSVRDNHTSKQQLMGPILSLAYPWHVAQCLFRYVCHNGTLLSAIATMQHSAPI